MFPNRYRAIFHGHLSFRYAPKRTRPLERNELYLFIRGVLIDFISIPVTVGFTSATSVIIATSQLKSLFGLKISASGFMDTIVKVAQNIHKTRVADLGLGLICIAALLFLRVGP